MDKRVALGRAHVCHEGTGRLVFGQVCADEPDAARGMDLALRLSYDMSTLPMASPSADPA